LIEALKNFLLIIPKNIEGEKETDEEKIEKFK